MQVKKTTRKTHFPKIKPPEENRLQDVMKTGNKTKKTNTDEVQKPECQTAYRLLSPRNLNSQHQSDKLCGRPTIEHILTFEFPMKLTMT